MESIGGIILLLILAFWIIVGMLIFGMLADEHYISSLDSLVLYLEHKINAIFNSDGYLGPIYYYKLSLIKQREGDTSGVLRVLDLALKAPYIQNSDYNYHVTAYYTRGTIRGRLKDYEGAVSDYSQAIRLNPNFKEAYFPRAINYIAMKNVEEALNDLQQASDFFYKIGNSPLNTKVKELIKAIQENPDNINNLDMIQEN